MYKYETLTFGCFTTKGIFNEKLQNLLNKYSKKGFKLHTMQVVGVSASICVCILEKKYNKIRLWE